MPTNSQLSQKSNSSTDYFEEDDSQFLQALETTVLPGDIISSQSTSSRSPTLTPPPPGQPRRVEESDDDDYIVDTVRSPVLSPVLSYMSTPVLSPMSSPVPSPEPYPEPPPHQSSLKRKRVEDEDIFRDRPTSPTKVNQVQKVNEEIYGVSNGDFGQYMRQKRAKLQIQNAEIIADNGGELKSRIFQGISIYVNGYTSPSVQDLRRIIIQHGGTFQPYLDRKSLITHIITNILTPAKIKEFQYMKVVTPKWITESVKAGFLLSWKDYVYVPRPPPEPPLGPKVPKQQSIIAALAKQGPLVISGNNHRPVGALNQAVLGSKYPMRKPWKPPVKSKAVTNDQVLQRGIEIMRSKAKMSHLSKADIIRRKFRLGQLPVKPLAKAQVSKLTSVPTANALYTTDPATFKDTKRIPGYSAFKSNALAERVMANPEWTKAHTSVAPDFVEGFYRNSRLHYLSTWKAELKNLVQEAQERAETTGIHGHGFDGHSIGKINSEAQLTGGSSSKEAAQDAPAKGPPLKWKGKQKAVEDQNRVIMHCDFDCFFVSVGLTTRPHLKGKPVVVCHSQGGQGGASSTSEIASASYEARDFGIKNGMSLQQARSLCPSIITIPYEFEKYKQISLNFYTVLMSLADDLQAVSVDEALIDVTSTVSQQQSRIVSEGSQIDPAKDFAETIRAQVREATSCEVSIGISYNIMLARLATRKAKPAGSFHLTPESVSDFLAPLDLSDLHGFGWATKQKAQEKLGTSVLGELLKKSKGALCDALGKGTGETVYKAIRGIDDKKLESDKPRKSVSCDINYGIRFENNEQAEAFMYQMAAEIKRRLDAVDMVGRSLTLKIMKRDPAAPVEPPKFMGHGACDLFSKNIHLLVPGSRGTSDDQIIGENAWRLLKSFNFDPKELRGIGIQIQKLESASGTVNVPAGQALLPFKKPVDGPSVQRQVAVQPPVLGVDIVMTDIPGAKQNLNPPTNNHGLPSFSQVDHGVLEALPREIREEIELEYKRRSESPFIAAGQVGADDIPGPGPATLAREKREKRQLEDQKELRKLAKRYIPRRAHARGAIPLQGLNGRLKAKRRKPKTKRNLKVADTELRKYNIDPDVFYMLPIKIQREQLIVARLVKQNQGVLPVAPRRERLRLKARKPKPVPDHLRWVAPAPVAKYKQMPSLHQQGKGKEKLHFTETDDVLNIVEKWVTAYQHWAPKEKDVEFLRKYLLKSVDGSIASDVGVERAIAVMKWWMVLLRRFWPGGEYVEDDDDLYGSQSDRVTKAWWDAFRDVKAQMDEIAKKRFGGKLSLK